MYSQISFTFPHGITGHKLPDLLTLICQYQYYNVIVNTKNTLTLQCPNTNMIYTLQMLIVVFLCLQLGHDLGHGRLHHDVTKQAEPVRYRHPGQLPNSVNTGLDSSQDKLIHNYLLYLPGARPIQIW